MKKVIWLLPLSVACDGPALCDTAPENHPALLVFDSTPVEPMTFAPLAL